MSNKDKKLQERQVVQLNIESLTGKTFQILASRDEKVRDLKERIELSEGISISQQHLVWRSLELNNEKSIEDYELQDGATLRLIPAMRGGPINFRRVQVQEQLPQEFLRRLAELDNVDVENPNGNRPIAMVVVRDGDMLNFFRLLDSDFSLENLSTANVFDIEEDLEEEEEEKLRRDEDNRMHQKVNALRKRMDSIAVDKTQVDLPKPIPPTRGVRKIPVFKPIVVNQKSKLPAEDPTAVLVLPTASHPTNDPSVTQAALDSSQSSKKRPSIPRQSTDEAGSSHHAALHRTSHVLLHDSQRKSSTFSNRVGVTSVFPYPVNQSMVRFGNGGSLPQIARQTLASKSRRLSLPGKDFKTKGRSDVPTLNSSKRNSVLPDGSEQLMSDSVGSISNSFKALNSYLMLADTFPGGARYNQPTNDLPSKVDAYSLNPSTPVSPAQPLVKEDVSRKKVTRCSVCSKKTGLASTYECRCLKSFCAEHRYPETHQCSFDYKGEGRKELKENNPVVIAPKLPKI